MTLSGRFYHRRRWSLHFAFCLAILSTSTLALAQTAIDVTSECVENYTVSGYGSISNQIVQCNDFMSDLTSCVYVSGGSCTTNYIAGPSYPNYAVYPTDFQDSNNVAAGQDNWYFDQDASANSYHHGIAMFAGHGECGDIPQSPPQSCTATSQCTSPGAGQSTPGICQRDALNSGVSSGHCVYTRDRRGLTDVYAGPNGYDWDYSNGSVAFGEQASWHGAGTNGGDNFVVINNSCGLRAGLFFQNVQNMFAGVRSVAMVMPDGMYSTSPTVILADAAQIDRTSSFTYQYTINPTGSIGHAWGTALASVSGGGSCAIGSNSSGHSMNGCGAMVTVSFDDSAGDVTWDRDSDTWLTADDDGYDSAGNSWMTYSFGCNYDCATYPWTM